MLTTLCWALYSLQSILFTEGKRELKNAWPPQTNSDMQMYPNLPPPASFLRTELGNRDHHAGWMGLRQISISGIHLRAKHCHVTTESRCPDATPSTPQPCQPGQSSWTARSRLGHQHLTSSGVPASQASAPVAQALL